MTIDCKMTENAAGELVCAVCGREKFGARGYMPCPCEAGSDCDVPSRFRGSAAKQPRPVQSSAWEAAMAWANTLPSTRTGLYLWGPTGSGKTTLAWALMELAAKKSVATLGYETTHLMAAAREAMQLKCEAPGRACREAGLLLLDDLGAERWSEFVAQTIGEIITYRYSMQLPTIITSNLPPVKPLIDGTPWLSTYADERIAERIREMCQTINVAGRQRGR